MKKKLRIYLILPAALLAAIVLISATFHQKPVPRPLAQAIRLAGAGGMAQGANITQIATSPGLPGVMLAGVRRFRQPGTAPIYSLDYGAHWQSFKTWSGLLALPWSDAYEPSTVAVTRGSTPEEARFLVANRAASTEATNGIFRLVARQDVWAKSGIPACPAPYTREYFSEMLVSPADPQRVYITRYCDDLPANWNRGERVNRLLYEGYASQDGGLRFQRVYQKAIPIDPPVVPPIPNLPGSLTPSPVQPDWVFLGAEMASQDGGRNWKATNFPVTSLTPDGLNAYQLYGFRRERGKPDTGMTHPDSLTGWKVWAEQPCANIAQLIADPAKTGVLFLRCGVAGPDPGLVYPPDTGLFRSADAGDHWKKIASWSGRWIGPDYSAAAGRRVLWARDDGLWATADHGEHWVRLTDVYLPTQEPREWDNATPPEALFDSKLEMITRNDIWTGDKEGELAHWDGQTWTKVSYPKTTQMAVYDLAFVASDNGWMVAVNPYDPIEDRFGAVYHWDGRAWQQVGDNFTGMLYGISAIGQQAWAVGENGRIVHWDGSRWTAMAGPADNLRLKAIAMLSPEEGWAVGQSNSRIEKGVILHYRQGAWKIEYDSGEYIGDFRSIAMVSPRLGWVAGFQYGLSATGLLRWDGETWQPQTETGAVEPLTSVAAASPRDAWAGGDRLLHWNGAFWNVVDLPGTPSPRAGIADLGMLPDGDLWLATLLDGTMNKNFILHRDPGP